MAWTKQSPIDAKNLHLGCATCSTARMVAPMEMLLAVGFGSTYVTRDGDVVYDESDIADGGEYWTVADAEKLAAADPDHDWRIVKYGPMHGESFQRHGPENWVCIESNEGFA
ncbi:MAG: hypothetical protein ABIH03_04625 [Pseudomonadota bacterium]